LLSGAATVALADNSSRQSTLESLYTYSGVHAHLSWVHATVIDEVRPAWQACDNHEIRTEAESILKQSLSIEELKSGFLAELDKRINDEHLAQITLWMQTDAGKKIYKAELASLDFDEQEFESLLEKYKQSQVHSDARNNRLQQMLEDTGAVYFLSALNTELSALVAVASVCKNAKKELAAAQKQIDEERSSEAFYRSFMRQELLVPAAVVYRGITDAQLDALSAFAKSNAGNAYYAALIKGTRSLLASKVDLYTEMLGTMPAEVD